MSFCSLLEFVFAGNTSSRARSAGVGLDLKWNKILAMQSGFQLQPCSAAVCCGYSGTAGDPACPGFGKRRGVRTALVLLARGSRVMISWVTEPAEGPLAVLCQVERNASAASPPRASRGQGGFGMFPHQSGQGRSLNVGVRPRVSAPVADALCRLRLSELCLIAGLRVSGFGFCVCAPNGFLIVTE